MLKETALKIRALRDEIDPEFQKECRTRYLRLRERWLMEWVKEIKTDYVKCFKGKDAGFWTGFILVNRDYKGSNKEILKIQKEISFMRLKKKDNSIDEYMIAKAQEYPIGDIVEVNNRGFALCVEHEDKKIPNMYCAGNFAYCFSCGYRASVIDLFMRVYNTDFISAVKQMQ